MKKKIIGFWGPPAAGLEDEFEEQYERLYLPLVHAVPGVERIELVKADPDESDPAIWRVGGFIFADEAAYGHASSTPEWQAMFECASELLERFGVSLTVAIGHGN